MIWHWHLVLTHIQITEKKRCTKPHTVWIGRLLDQLERTRTLNPSTVIVVECPCSVSCSTSIYPKIVPQCGLVNVVWEPWRGNRLAGAMSRQFKFPSLTIPIHYSALWRKARGEVPRGVYTVRGSCSGCKKVGTAALPNSVNPRLGLCRQKMMALVEFCYHLKTPGSTTFTAYGSGFQTESKLYYLQVGSNSDSETEPLMPFSLYPARICLGPIWKFKEEVWRNNVFNFISHFLLLS